MKIFTYYKTNSPIWKIGFWLVIVMVLFGISTPLQTSMKGLIDFPCEYYYGITSRFQIQADSRIAYCISFFPREFGGGGIYADGVSKENKVFIPPKSIVDGITIERNEDTLTVNGKTVEPDDALGFKKTYIVQSINPWLFLTATTFIKNNGFSEINPQVIYVSGEVAEGWRYSPTGLIIMLIAIGLMFFGKNKRQENA